MTTIIWDGNVLCADRRAVEGGGLCRTVMKIFKVRGALLGFGGNLSHGLQLRDWYAAGAEPSKYPKPENPNDDARILVIEPDKRIWVFEGPVPWECLDPFIAIGSGREIAMGIMMYIFQSTGFIRHGTAEEVMSTVKLLDSGTGNGMDCLSFDDVDEDVGF